ncbi:SGNH/GDSL hydrolase family protein [Microbulbifer sp.]|uniref:SGNH/GDSL hydrolase family protein n=1 Tax=Microbulbifer sp. TaxID=1908541 RepID=UPI003F313878
MFKNKNLVIPGLFTAALIFCSSLAAAVDTTELAPSGAPFYYLALGDSLAAGEQPDGEGGQIVGDGYAERLLSHFGPDVELVNLGCSGETTSSMIYGIGSRCTYPGAVSQLDAAVQFLLTHPGQVMAVTLNIGADHFSGCEIDAPDTTCLVDQAATVSAELPPILYALRRAAEPETKIAAMTYYDPFLAHWLLGEEGRLQAELTSLAVTSFNLLEASIYTAQGVRVAHIGDAFETLNQQPTIYRGRVMPTNVVRICQFTWMCELGDIHANDAGYQLIADTFAETLGLPVVFQF